MLIEKMRMEKRNGILLTADFSGPVEQYALAYLKLVNNAREYPKMIWNVENDRGNNVYVICNPKSVDSVKDFINNIHAYYDEESGGIKYIGKILKEKKIVVGVPIYEYYTTLDFNDENWENDIDQSISWWAKTETEFI